MLPQGHWRQECLPALSAIVFKGTLRAFCTICTPTCWSKLVSFSFMLSSPRLA